MTLVTPENGHLLDKRILEYSAGFVRDYLKKDQIHAVLEGRKEKKGIWSE